MNLDLKDITAKIIPLIQKLKRFIPIIFLVIVSVIFGFLVLRINSYAQTEPTEEEITEKLTTVQRPKIDENALAKIQQLKDQNVEVQTLFKQARDNPFSE